MGRWLTRALFFETATPEMRDKYECLFTLKEEDHVSEDGTSYRSLRKIYLSYNDPTGYLFATEVLGSWDHWQAIKRSSFFKEYLASWEEELEIKLLAKGFAGMLNEMDSAGKGSATASKWLAEKGWDRTSAKGRPSKAKIDQEAAKQLRVFEEVDELLTHGNTIQ